MNSSGYWDQSSIQAGDSISGSNGSGIGDSGAGDHHEIANSTDITGNSSLRLQHTIPAEELADSIDHSHYEEQPSLEQVQRVYYARGLEELDELQLLDVSALANWKLSSNKPGYGLGELRSDTPDMYWQSDGSNGGGANNTSTAILNNQLSNPHLVTVQFAKKVSLERVSLFTNFLLDESYTPLRIRIMAGSTEADLSEVCTVSFSKPVGWLHIIFNGIRGDGVLKCFMVKLVILANHQDGKDSHIRAIRCFGRKATKKEATEDVEVASNVNDVIGFNTGFQSLAMTSVATIR